jgi:hypothetical protein
MATAKPNRNSATGATRQMLRNGLVVVALVAAMGMAIAGAVYWPRLQARAMVATSYGARIACTCHYIAGRSLKDCRKDFEPGMALVMLDENAEARSVTARVPMIASQAASFREGAGCLLQTWVP